MCVQKTHVSLGDAEIALPNAAYVSSREPSGLGGGLPTLLDHRWLGDRRITGNSVVPGRCLRTIIWDGDCPCFKIYNVHLEGPNHTLEEQVAVLDELASAGASDPSDLQILMGDFNFEFGVEAHLSHSSSLRKYHHKVLADAFVKLFKGWTKLSTPYPTYLGARNQVSCCIDHCFFNVPGEFIELSSFQSSVLVMSACINEPRLSDHVPLLVAPQHLPLDHLARLPLPSAIASCKAWRDMVQAWLREHRSEMSACELLAQWPSTLKRITKQWKRSSCEIPGDAIELSWCYLNATLRLVLKGCVNEAAEVIKCAPHWRLKLTPESTLVSHLLDLIAATRTKLLKARASQEHVQSAVAHDEPITTSQQQKWTRVLASWRAGVTIHHLVSLDVGGEIADDPDEVLHALTGHWAPAFEAQPSVEGFDEFLSYAKAVEWPSCPYSLQPM